MRIKDKWHQSRRNQPTAKSLHDSAEALAFIGWRLALDKAQNLHREAFRYDSDIERIGVISEFVAFEIQVADRLVYESLNDDERRLFINTLGQRLADHMQENLSELDGSRSYRDGPRDYRGGSRNYRDAFVALLNERLSDYATLSFTDAEPGFDFLRYFGSRVLGVLGNDQTNRWVQDQIITVEAPEVVEKIRKSVFNLLPELGPE